MGRGRRPHRLRQAPARRPLALELRRRPRQRVARPPRAERRLRAEPALGHGGVPRQGQAPPTVGVRAGEARPAHRRRPRPPPALAGGGGGHALLRAVRRAALPAHSQSKRRVRRGGRVRAPEPDARRAALARAVPRVRAGVHRARRGRDPEALRRTLPEQHLPARRPAQRVARRTALPAGEVRRVRHRQRDVVPRQGAGVHVPAEALPAHVAAGRLLGGAVRAERRPAPEAPLAAPLHGHERAPHAAGHHHRAAHQPRHAVGAPRRKLRAVQAHRRRRHARRVRAVAGPRHRRARRPLGRRGQRPQHVRKRGVRRAAHVDDAREEVPQLPRAFLPHRQRPEPQHGLDALQRHRARQGRGGRPRDRLRQRVRPRGPAAVRRAELAAACAVLVRGVQRGARARGVGHAQQRRHRGLEALRARPRAEGRGVQPRAAGRLPLRPRLLHARPRGLRGARRRALRPREARRHGQPDRHALRTLPVRAAHAVQGAPPVRAAPVAAAERERRSSI